MVTLRFALPCFCFAAVLGLFNLHFLQVLRCLLTLVHRECGECKRTGGLMVVTRALSESPAILTGKKTNKLKSF